MLHTKVNIVPVIAKADCLTKFEVQRLKRKVSGMNQYVLLNKQHHMHTHTEFDWFLPKICGRTDAKMTSPWTIVLLLVYHIKQIDSILLSVCSVWWALCATIVLLPHFDVICYLLLSRCMATWNLIVLLLGDQRKKWFFFVLFWFFFFLMVRSPSTDLKVRLLPCGLLPMNGSQEMN